MLKCAKILFLIFITIQLATEAKKNEILMTEELPLYEVYADEISNSAAKEIAKEYNLVYIGGGGRMPYDVEEIKIYFHAYRRVTIEEARELEVKAIERLLKKINEHEKIRPFLREYPFKVDRARVRISFRKSNGTHYADGSVDLIFNAYNNLYYSAQDSQSEKLLALMNEPYEDARKIVEKDSKARGIYQSGKKL